MLARVRRSRGIVPFTAGIVLAGFFAGRAEARLCEVSMRVDSAAMLGALQLDLDFSGTDGSIVTQAGKLACRGDVANTLTMFGQEASVVTVSVLSLVGFATPSPIAHCTFEDPDGGADAGDFELSVTDSTDALGEAVQAPHVSVEYGPCDDDTTTTSTSTTTSSTTTSTTSTSTSTTTLPDTCGDGVVDGTEDCDDGNDENGDGCDIDCTGIVCGDANGNDTVQSSDALLVLRAAIGQVIPCPVSLCDADGDHVLRASDSLRILRRAVGQSVVMHCGYV